MSNKNCGCSGNPGSGSENEYLMVKVSGASASTCGEPSSDGGNVINCAKQEPMFDVSLSDFLVPIHGNSSQIQVCNPAIYSVGMWVQFLSPYATFLIINITDNIISLANRCADGGVITSNPDPGAPIIRNSKFIVCDEPFCQSDDEALEILQNALSKATEICVPKMLECSATAIIQPVGRVSSDPSNASVKQCIRRIYGFLFNAGTPILSRLQGAKGENFSNYRILVKHKSTHEVKTMQSFSEWPNVTNSNQRALSVMSSGEKLVGPVSFFRPMYGLIFRNTSGMTESAWPTINTKITRTENMKDIALIAGVIRQDLDYIWVNIKLEFGLYTDTSSNYVIAKLNDSEVGRLIAANSSGHVSSITSVTVPVKIDTTNPNNWNLDIEFNSEKAGKLYYNASIAGVWI